MCSHASAGWTQDGHVGDILLALGDAAPITRLVLRANETVRGAAPYCFAIDIRRRVSNDVLDVGPDLLCSTQRPALLVGLGEEPGQF